MRVIGCIFFVPFWLWKRWRERLQREEDAILDAAQQGDLVAIDALMASGRIPKGTVVAAPASGLDRNGGGVPS